MPKKISQSELDVVRNVVASFVDGTSIDEVHSRLPKIPRRTLQRRLTTLVAQEQLVREGQGPSTRYRLPVIQAEVSAQLPAVTGEMTAEVYVPTSVEGEAVKHEIRRPLQNRMPVSYNREFLDEYRPNEDYYLPVGARRHLMEKGRDSNREDPAGTYVKKIFSRLLIDLSWNSSRLEGNTYSLLETERLLELGELVEGKNALEAQMILNHKAAIELLSEPSDETGFNRYTILNLHALLSENLLPNALACGRIREVSVGVDGTVYHPLEVPQIIGDCFDVMLAKADAIEDPFEQAFFIMVHLPYLQAFEDVNKRVSRLAANIPLVRENLCPLSFVDVPQRAYVDGTLAVYELNRVELLRDVFIWAYERSCARYSAVRQSLGEPDPFRLRYRSMIAELVSEMVRSKLNKVEAISKIHLFVNSKVTSKDRARFVEVVETELMSLHEGNIARYRLRPSEYQCWKQGWR